MEPEEFYAECCRKLYGEDGDAVLFALKHMLTIHESQLNLFPQYLPFAAHKVEAQDIPRIEEAMKDTEKIIEELTSLLEKLI